MTSDRVFYDCTTTWDDTPYRSDHLYGPDLRLINRHGRPGVKVQVIKERGDLHWTNATFHHWDSVESGEVVRYYVTLADGSEHRVSADRIRLA